MCKICAKMCSGPKKEKSRDKSYDLSQDFGALAGTRIPGPLIKSQMLYRLSYERIYCILKQGSAILPDYFTTPGHKLQELPQKSPPAGRRGGRKFLFTKRYKIVTMGDIQGTWMRTFVYQPAGAAPRLIPHCKGEIDL